MDGDFFQDHPYALIERGAMAKIPVVITVGFVSHYGRVMLTI